MSTNRSTPKSATPEKSLKPLIRPFTLSIEFQPKQQPVAAKRPSSVGSERTWRNAGNATSNAKAPTGAWVKSTTTCRSNVSPTLAVTGAGAKEKMVAAEPEREVPRRRKRRSADLMFIACSLPVEVRRGVKICQSFQESFLAGSAWLLSLQRERANPR